jgi:hypothetical protein
LPEKRAAVETREKHTYQVLTRKQEKKSKFRTKQKKCLSRKEKSKLGLFTLPRKSMKYADMLPLNQLWSQYMKDQLNLTDQEAKIPTVLDANYERFG